MSRFIAKIFGPLPACTSDACGQGDRPCPTPEACRLPDPIEEETADEEFPWFWWGCGMACAATLLISILVGPQPWFGG